MSKTKRRSGGATAQNVIGTEEPMEVDEPEPEAYSDEDGGTRIGDIYIPPPMKPYCSTESKGPRLIITEIENENFKSYAGTVSLGPFHHCFTAIIGPNGSGKSNVIDSMLFVFGYKAQKIRCKKLSVLLHNSSKYPNMTRCSVAVHFKQILDREDGGCEGIPGSELVIARTAFKDNTSFYTINGKKVQFKEVSKLLKQHGVDLDHNRFLILQGEVESIAMMKSKAQNDNDCGMLEYLEDIIGTTRYKEPLVKINDRVETLTEERTEKHNRCKLAEREMKDLEQPYNEAVEYLKLENSLTRTKNLQIQKYLSEQNKKLKDFSTEREEIDGDLRKHDEHFDSLVKQRLEKEAAINEEIAQFDKMCQEKDAMEKTLRAVLNQYAEIQATMEATNRRRKENKVQLEAVKAKLVDLKKKPDKNLSEIAECEKKVERLTEEKEELQETLQKNYAEIDQETRPLIEKKEKLETQMIDLQKNVDESKAELELVESELRILRDEETTEKRKYQTLASSYESSKSDLNEKIAACEALKTEIPQLQTFIEEKAQKIQQYKTEEQMLTTKVQAMKADVSEKINSMQAAKSNNKVLNSLMKQKIEGRIPGILGRLGDLGGIDAKYDVAISTACGRLDNIIVDTVNTAQECIEHLKRHDVGRASFIALEKVDYLLRDCGRIETPENVPRLFDLVRVEDERVIPAFYFALRDTLVANDLEQGSRIAYGARRHRVVTLRGELIETSGTMSGGGTTQMRGKMGQKVTTKTASSANTSLTSQKTLDDLQRQAEEMQSRVNYLQHQQGLLEQEIQTFKMTLHQKQAELKKLNVSVKSLQEQLPRIQNQVEQQQKRVDKIKTDPEKVKNLEVQIDTKRQTFESSEKEAKKISTKVDEINKKISDIHGDKVKSVQRKIDNLTKQIVNLNKNVSKLKVEITTSERNCTKAETQIEDITNEIKNSEESLRALSEDRAKADEEGSTWTKKIEEAKEEIEKARSGSSHIKKEIIAMQKVESDEKLKRVEFEHKLQTLDKKISDVKSQLPHWQNKLKPLKLNNIPGETEPMEPLKTYTEEELATYKLQDLQYQFSVQEEKLNAKKPNLSVIQEYLNKREVYLQRVQILEDITNKRNEMRQLFDDVRKKRYTEFMQGFHIITRKLKEMYQMITQGGDAELELVDSMDPFTEGVSFSVRPPKKTWKNISNLSGGEKTLSSLALVFALHYYKPSPLYFMDEIDAALDFKNISIVAHYIKQRTKNAQFIIISLRSNMFELADYLVGIYKIRDCTNSVTIENTPPQIELEKPCDSSQTNLAISNSSITETLVVDN